MQGSPRFKQQAPPGTDVRVHGGALFGRSSPPILAALCRLARILYKYSPIWLKVKSLGLLGWILGFFNLSPTCPLPLPFIMIVSECAPV
jgi:hypothetical protein